MNKINVLDCTLRDGGYCNEWKFGFENAGRIITACLESNIDIIECGFLTSKVSSYDPNITKFSSLEQVAKLIPKNREEKIFVVMMNYGEYNIEDLPKNDGSSVDGIRVAFHKRDLNEALTLCEQIKAKGYLVFIQAMVSLCYTDQEFLSMISHINSFEPYAFYIVDSFGMMKGKDLTRFFYMVEHNLKENIWIGFHSHNNLQLSYSNAQALTRIQTNRNLIIDSSIMGMGRGAGNLNTELFLDYLNENFSEEKYDIRPLLYVIDKILNNFYQASYWGYSLPNYISATHNAHPNYARYLDEKRTLTIEAMNDIFDMMDKDKKVSYDKKYIENLYSAYMNRGKAHEEHKAEFRERLFGKKVILIAPGRSSVDEKEKIIAFASREDVITININFDYEFYKSDFIFIPNLRRFKELDPINRPRCIITSNIDAAIYTEYIKTASEAEETSSMSKADTKINTAMNSGVYYQIKYRDLLNDEEAVRDNASLMAIKFLINQGVKEIYLAGLDGYSHDARENYGRDDMAFFTRNAVLDAMNAGMCKVLKEYAKEISIKFITTPKFVRIGEYEMCNKIVPPPPQLPITHKCEIANRHMHLASPLISLRGNRKTKGRSAA